MPQKNSHGIPLPSPAKGYSPLARTFYKKPATNPSSKGQEEISIKKKSLSRTFTNKTPAGEDQGVTRP
jgi:hypothetical protein